MMKLDLRFSDHPLEDLWCEAVVIFVFQKTPLLEDPLSRINEKMAGLLGKIEKNGFWTGRLGEIILLASQNTIMADKMLLIGLGKDPKDDDQVLVDCVKEVGNTLDKLKISDFVIHIAPVIGSMERYAYCLELVACHLVETFLQKHHHETDFLLKIVFSIGKEPELNPLIGRLRGHLTKSLDISNS
ncbi:MAG: M17 family peptidase N-terminal domain-containing protein [Pseudomonadota bacterium]